MGGAINWRLSPPRTRRTTATRRGTSFIPNLDWTMSDARSSSPAEVTWAARDLGPMRETQIHGLRCRGRHDNLRDSTHETQICLEGRADYDVSCPRRGWPPADARLGEDGFLSGLKEEEVAQRREATTTSSHCRRGKGCTGNGASPSHNRAGDHTLASGINQPPQASLGW